MRDVEPRQEPEQQSDAEEVTMIKSALSRFLRSRRVQIFRKLDVYHGIPGELPAQRRPLEEWKTEWVLGNDKIVENRQEECGEVFVLHSNRRTIAFADWEKSELMALKASSG
jgi:hypothetical protein